MYDLPRFPSGKRLTAKQRALAKKKLPIAYEQGASIRAIGQGINRSFGFVHRMLTEECGVELRRRGGKNHVKSP